MPSQPPAKLSSATKPYTTLLTQLQKVFVDGMKKIEEQRVKTYWQTGKLISKYILKNKERADCPAFYLPGH